MLNISTIPSKIQPATLNAKGLANRKLSKTRRALLVADIAAGVVKLDEFSIRQLSQLLGVSVPYINAARALSWSNRYAVETGQRKLAEFLPQPNPAKQISQVVRRVGIDETLALLAAAE
jgi:hypothetical protein